MIYFRHILVDLIFVSFKNYIQILNYFVKLSQLQDETDCEC